MKGESASAKWQPAHPSDIPSILKNWDAKFRPAPQEEKPTAETPTAEAPTAEAPTAGGATPTKQDQPITEKKKEKENDKPAKFEPSEDEIRSKVISGECDINCINSYKTLTSGAKDRLKKYLPSP